MKDIMKMVNCHGTSGLLVKEFTKKLKKDKRAKGQMLLGKLGENL